VTGRDPESGKLAAIIGVLDALDAEGGDAEDAMRALGKIEQIAATSRVATGIDIGGQAVIMPADLVTLRQALADAIKWRRHSADDKAAVAYKALAARLAS
jgi:hypothetical protein